MWNITDFITDSVSIVRYHESLPCPPKPTPILVVDEAGRLMGIIRETPQSPKNAEYPNSPKPSNPSNSPKKTNLSDPSDPQGPIARDIMEPLTESLEATTPAPTAIKEACRIFALHRIVPVTTNGILSGTLDMEPFTSHVSNLLTYFQTVLDYSDDSIWLTDENGNIIFASAATKPISGKDPDELKNLNVEALLRKGIIYPSSVLLAIQSRQRVTILQDTASGKRVAVTATPILCPSKKEIKHVLTVSRDVIGLLDLIRELYPKKSKDMRRVLDIKNTALDNNQAHLMSKKEMLEEEGCIYQSTKMQQIISLLKKLGKADITVLFLGETGVGKGFLARLLSEEGSAAGCPFLEINCNAIPRELLESELFGYEPGAFTGAQSKGKRGLVELAEGGSLFLDEIGDIPLELQGKILRLLDEKQYFRIGGSEPKQANTRIIAATNKDLSAMVAKGTFREDLYYRLSIIPIDVPPLRDRREDILPLLLYYLDIFNTKYKKNRSISSDTLNLFITYDWPGNVRQLRNVIERLVILGDTPKIQTHELPATIAEGSGKTEFLPEAVTVKRLLPFNEMIQQAERQIIELALERYGSTRKAAEVLEISQSSIVKKRKKWK